MISPGALLRGENFIASEHVQGGTLQEKITAGPIAFEQAAQWTRALALALDYAHREGVAHRDIKPANILVDAAGRPRLMDFGLAKRLDEDSQFTADGAILGTPAYMSPEQARGQVQPGRRVLRTKEPDELHKERGGVTGPGGMGAAVKGW